MVAGLTLAALAGLAYATYRLAGPHPSTPFQVMKVTRLTSSGKVREAAISPDGKYAAYVQEDAGQQSLWMRQFATEGNVRIVPANGQPFSGLTFSPDGNFIYRFRKFAILEFADEVRQSNPLRSWKPCSGAVPAAENGGSKRVRIPLPASSTRLR